MLLNAVSAQRWVSSQKQVILIIPDVPSLMCRSRTCPPSDQATAEPELLRQAACTCLSPAQRMLHSLLSCPGELLCSPSCFKTCTCDAAEKASDLSLAAFLHAGTSALIICSTAPQAAEGSWREATA